MLLLVLLIAFPYLFWTGWKSIRNARASAGWPSVPGVITGSQSRKVAWRTMPQVSYAYEVDGQKYTGTNVNFATIADARETARVLGRYPAGAQVEVHYDPQAPGAAALEPGPNRYASGALRIYVIWFLFIAAANGFLWWMNGREAAAPRPRTYDEVAAADTSEGDRLIQEDADKGDAKSQYYVGTFYLSGAGGYTKDLAKAAEWFRKAADQGDAKSQYYVGMFYLAGTGGYAKDPAQAAEWLRKAADHGDAQAQTQLGSLYASGNGVERDPAHALDWFHKAAAQGEPRACVWIGVAYEQGIGGLPKDKDQAIEWYKKAGDEPKAKEFLKRLGAE